MECKSPALMESLDSLIFENLDEIDMSRIPSDFDNMSFLLLDAQEELTVPSAEFLQRLNCGKKNKVKVISIFGDIDDRKCHAMNQTIFKGKEVFKTSNKQNRTLGGVFKIPSRQNSHTLGVWAAYDPTLNVICLNTEGLQDVTGSENESTRLLLKILAVSDIVIYQIQSERLDRELFTFLGAASSLYRHHFRVSLQTIGKQKGISSLSSLGPSIIVLHETKDSPLTNNGFESAEDILRTRFTQMKLEIDAFSSIKYVGLQTSGNSINYKQLQLAIKVELNNITIRSPRKPYLVYSMLETLNKFFSNAKNLLNTVFPAQYFTCPSVCLSCDSRCSNSMGHLHEGKPHNVTTRCRYQRQYENQRYICKKCYINGNEVEVRKLWQEQNENGWYNLAKNAWSGYIIDCPHCGEIYRSRQYWYGNSDPEDNAVLKKTAHVWHTYNHPAVSQNTAQRVIDSVSYITETVSSMSLQPTKALTSWVADQVAPSYWRPNHEIKHCHNCKTIFGLTDTKHHCRDCGEGFCAQCSSKSKCVPTRNWLTPVRVCDKCYDKDTDYSVDESIEIVDNVSARKVTEHVMSTLNVVGSVYHYSKSIIKDSVRPSYWIPDSEIVSCCVCDSKFSPSLPLHHCRECGRGVCQDCSPQRLPVPHRGWDNPVRVCNACIMGN